jgi:hypothetical protein
VVFCPILCCIHPDRRWNGIDVSDSSLEIVRLIASLPTQAILGVMIYRIYIDAIKGVVWLQGVFEKLLDYALDDETEKEKN